MFGQVLQLYVKIPTVRAINMLRMVANKMSFQNIVAMPIFSQCILWD